MDGPFWCEVAGSTRREDAPCFGDDLSSCTGAWPFPCADVYQHQAPNAGGCPPPTTGGYRSDIEDAFSPGFGSSGGYSAGSRGTWSSTNGNRDSSSSTFWSEAAGVVRREDDGVRAILPPSNSQRTSREARQSPKEDEDLSRSVYSQPRTPSRRYPLPDPAPPERSTRDQRRESRSFPSSSQTFFGGTRSSLSSSRTSGQRPYARDLRTSLDGYNDEDPPTDSRMVERRPQTTRIEASRTERIEQLTGNTSAGPFSRSGISLGTHQQVRKPPPFRITFQAQVKINNSLGEVTHKG